MEVSIGDTILFMVPTLILLVVGVLRLDEHLFASARKPARAKSRFANCREGDEMLLSDPDGRVSRARRKR